MTSEEKNEKRRIEIRLDKARHDMRIAFALASRSKGQLDSPKFYHLLEVLVARVERIVATLRGYD